ncbi:methionyl-tRNA formyltransferase [Patescibacteria group bacterium]|nr:methionyl-tRNA formyltransferase [Patescibacteria group bacterium]MBU2265011.1 methionyl-tRNA formyltransferase [Patescibacteria group bacterium]
MQENQIKVNKKIIFLGTPDFAVPILEKLINSDYKPVAVFCAPDKPVGRKQNLTPLPTKILAQKHNIPVFQPANSHELADTLKTTPHDLIVTTAYGLILPKEILLAPKYGCLNIHPSLLPKYRGPSPIQAAILNGDAATGVTIYKMDEQIDHGPIIAQERISLSSVVASEAKQSRNTAAVHSPSRSLGRSAGEIATSPTTPRNDKLTTPELSDKLSELGANLLLKILPDWLTAQITPQPQDDSQATFTKIITKEDGQIDWQKSALAIERQIRAYTPWPGSHATLLDYSLSEAKGRVEGSKIKIIQADAVERNYGQQIGKIFLTETSDLIVQTGDGALIVKKLQMEGGKPLDVSDFLRGHSDIIRQVLK